MMGSFLTRGLVMVFGYAYPAYECFKTVEKNKPEIEQLRFWCQYWILVALLTVFERLGDTFVSWVPMYSEAKLAFFIYLWYPKTKGTTYVYDSFFRPYVAKHEPDIDRNLLELKTRAGDMAILYCQRAATYGQTRIFEILQYVAAQSTPTPRPSQQGTGARVAIVRPEQEDITVVAAPPPQPQQQQPQQQPPPPQSRTSSSTAGPTQKQQASLARSSSATSSTQQQQHQPPSRASSTPRQQQETSVSEVEPSTSVQPPATITDTKADAAVVAASSTSPTPQEDVLMEEVIRVTRGRLRKNRAVAATKT